MKMQSPHLNYIKLGKFNMRTCWCEKGDTLVSFSSKYSLCTACGTLISNTAAGDEVFLVGNDETDFYGKQYWLTHQSEDLGYTDIYARARADLCERNLHWLKVLLKYKMPPAKIMELGCSHGSFVFLMQQAGFDAYGIELSPWVVEFGQKIFDVPIQLGPLEALPLKEHSFDAIVLMDVLEHLPHPLETMKTCLRLLKPDGILLIQTPNFEMHYKYSELLEAQHPFLVQLKDDEHLFLFSKKSVSTFFERLNAPNMQFEDAIFAHYDMFFAVSQMTLKQYTDTEIEAWLLSTPHGRYILSLFDLWESNKKIMEQFLIADHDRNERAKQIEKLIGLMKPKEMVRHVVKKIKNSLLPTR